MGSRVRDKISGFTGIATARTEYLNGCARVVVEPDKLGEKGELIEGKYFDEPQLDVLLEGVISLGPDDVGGPHDHAVPAGHRR